MFRLLVVGKNEVIAKEGANWVVSNEGHDNIYEKSYENSGRTISIKAHPLWIDMTGTKPIGDGLLLIARTAEDLTDMEGFLESYKRMPIKFVLYDGAPDQTEFEVQWAAKSITKGEPLAFVEKLIVANNELVKLIASVFKTFDKNGDGKIELIEIGLMSKELGTEISAEEAKKIIHALDINKDGKISLEEFIEWWKTGGQGKANMLGGIIKQLIVQNPTIQAAYQAIKAIQASDKNKPKVGGSLKIYANKVTNPGIEIELTALGQGQEKDAEFQLYSNAVGAGKDLPFIGISFGVKNPKPANDKLKELIDMGIMMDSSQDEPICEEALSYLDLKYGVSADKAIIGAFPTELLMPMITPIIEIMDGISNIMNINECFKAKLSFAADFNKLITEDRSFYDILLDGINFEMNGSLDSGFTGNIVKVINAMGLMNNIPAEFQQIILSLSLAFGTFQSFDSELEFEIGQNVREAINNEITDETVKIPLKILKESVVPQISAAILSIPPLEAAYNLFKDEINAIDIFLYAGKIGCIKLHMNLPGLDSFISF